MEEKAPVIPMHDPNWKPKGIGGGVMSHEELQEEKRKRIARERQAGQEKFNPEEDAKALGLPE